MKDEKIAVATQLPSKLYTAEASATEKAKAKKELVVPDPLEDEAEAAIKKNTKNTKKKETKDE